MDELRTLLVEVEARINNRPLTYIQESIDEPAALTPNHLLQSALIDVIPPIISKIKINDPDFTLTTINPNSEDMNKRFNHLNKILKQWNKIWGQEYLTSLRERHYGNKASNTPQSLKIGDIVLIDSDSSRTTWPLGKIISLHPDKHGYLRFVKVLSKGLILLRTVDKLVPLEISETSPELNDGKNDRATRLAESRARARCRTMINQGTV